VRRLIRSIGIRLYLDSERINVKNIERAVRKYGRPAHVLDLGCGDGKTTMAICSAVGAKSISGVERHDASRAAARGRGIDTVFADLDLPLPFDDGAFDVVISNQVIEHLSDTDRFVSEIFRVLVPGGLAVVSTENMASWHNVAALTLGYAPFSASNYSNKIYPLGNPLSIHHGDVLDLHDGMVHRRIFTTTSLRALFAGHGFVVRDVLGAGYHPLPPALGRIDARHAHFITIAATKPAA
jgi:SAM-dependent methyltransferase